MKKKILLKKEKLKPGTNAFHGWSLGHLSQPGGSKIAVDTSKQRVTKLWQICSAEAHKLSPPCRIPQKSSATFADDDCRSRSRSSLLTIRLELASNVNIYLEVWKAAMWFNATLLVGYPRDQKRPITLRVSKHTKQVGKKIVTARRATS